MKKGLILLLLFICSTISTKNTLYLSIEENIDSNSNPIGNIAKLIKNQTKLTEKFTKFELDRAKSSNYRYIKYIKIIPKTGDIWLQSSIDREDICYRLNNCNNDLTKLEYLVYVDNKVFELIIEIKDKNDNYPIFQLDSKIIEIPESITKGTIYSLPIATDKDSSKYGIKRYYLNDKTNGDYKKYFQLKNETELKPHLIVINDIDRELINKFEFYLYAIDGGQNQGRCEIIIKVMDINDNTPQWSGLPYKKVIKECTTSEMIMKLLAEDKDDPTTNGGRVEYRISENTENYEWISKTFFISNDNLYMNSGALKSYGKPYANIIIVASDGGGRINETTVEITITDCNDHAPTISLDDKTRKVKENEKKIQQISRITVEDRDKGQNSNFHCYLNDTMYMELIETYAVTNEFGHQLKTYLLQTRKDISFDREKIASYSLTLICKDTGTPIMTDEKIIKIYIEDENDNAPDFGLRKHISFYVSEDILRGSVIGTVRAIDIDDIANNVVQYKIIGDKIIHDTFHINRNGEINLKQLLDRETVDNYKFKILATDNGKPQSLNDTCTVTVIVTDVNDCAPQIEPIYEFSIVESNGKDIIHKTLGRLNATDQDKGRNGTIGFRMAHRFNSYPRRSRYDTNNNINNNRINIIRITEDGLITIYGNIDREKSDTLQAIVLVYDKGEKPLTSTTSILIKVLDLNDNAPVFRMDSSNSLLSRTNIEANITSEFIKDNPILTLQADDPDLGENGTVTFSLLNKSSSIPFNKRYSGSNYFSVRENGQIILVNDPSVELRKQNYPPYHGRRRRFQMIVEAKDGGTPPQSTTHIVFINYYLLRSDTDSDGGGSMNGGRNNNLPTGSNPNQGSGYKDGSNKYANNNPSRNNDQFRGGRGGRRTVGTVESRYLLILLVCVVSLVLIVFGIALFCFLRQHCLRRQDMHTTKQHRSGNPINTSVSSSVNPSYHKAQKISKNKSIVSSGSNTIMTGIPNNNSYEAATLNNTFHMDPGHHQINDNRPGNYTNLTRFKNEIYSPIQFGGTAAPGYSYQGPIGPHNPNSPLLTAQMTNYPNAFQSTTDKSLVAGQPQNYDLDDSNSILLDPNSKWAHQDPFEEQTTKSLVNSSIMNNQQHPTSSSTLVHSDSTFHNNNNNSKTFTPGLERRPFNNNTRDSNPNIIKSDSTHNIKFNYVTSSFV